METPTPALPPPPGVTSNFVNPPSLGKEMNITMGIAVPLIVIFFGLRTYVRIFIRRTWTFEDWLALTAWVGTVSFAGVGAATMAHNGGKHGWDITPAQAQEASYWFNVASIHYGITICVAKLAVLLLYRRVFSPQRATPFDITIIFLNVLLILFYTAISIVKIWECVPREKIFNDKITGSCINTPILLNVSGIFNTVTDLIILLLPVKVVWGLNMRPREKVAVVLVFTFGLCAPAFSLAGTIVRIQGTNNPDKTWVQPDIIMWGLAELTTGILCVSLPETGPLWKKKEHPRPTASILNGTCRLNPPLSRKKKSRRLSSVMSRSTRHLDSETYLTLEERDMHGHDAQQEDRGDNHHYRNDDKFTLSSR